MRVDDGFDKNELDNIMAAMKILTVPNKILRQNSSAVMETEPGLNKFVNQISETLVNKKNPEGVGLSAPQVGKLWRVFVTYLGDRGDRDLKIYINPEINSHSEELTLGPNKDKPFLEGCLSIPDIYGPVWRYQWVRMGFLTFDDDGVLVEREEKLTGFEARVAQHEYDHLNGVLFTERTLEDGLPLYREIANELVELELT